MKKGLVLIAAIMVQMIASSQSNDGVKLDLLKAPSSPAANLLGFATADIEKPTDLSSLMLSLQSNTSTFSKIPANYALDLAPFLLFRNKTATDITTSGLNSVKFSDIFKQTFVFSIATKNPDSVINNFKPTSTYTSFGFKFSLYRERYTESDQNALHEIYEVSAQLNKDIDDELKKKKSEKEKLYNERYEIIQKIREKYGPGDAVAFAEDLETNQNDSTKRLFKINRALEKINEEIIVMYSGNDATRNKLSAAIKKFGARRDGFSADIAGGLSLDFRNKQFNNSKIFNSGIWATLGYSKGGSSFLGLLRLLHNPNQVFAKNNQPNKFIADISTFDAGFRYVFSTKQSKFSSSLETIYRSVLSSNTINPSWRLVFNADYALWENQKLTFSFGRNFDGTTSKDGNLLAALTFLTGFGNKR